MAVTYLMDSNVLIDYTSNQFSGSTEKILDSIFDAGFHFSIISKIEVLGFKTSEEVLSELDEFYRWVLCIPFPKRLQRPAS